MYQNRTHAARPSALTPTDRARQRAAINRAEEARRRADRWETFKAWATVALIIGLSVAMFRSI